jgi:hypothetical protein
MKPYHSFAFILFVFLLSASIKADPGTAFTYQGRLADGATAIETPVDLRFCLFDAPASGVQIGGPITYLNTAYDGGIVQRDLDFGPGSFDGNPRWLEVKLANPAGDALTTLTPRIQILPSPYGMYAKRANNLSASDGDPIDAVVVDAEGRVGINTATPSELLTVDDGNILQSPGDPVLVGSLPLGGLPASLSVSGRYAYVIDQGSFDLKVIDVSIPSVPTVTGSLGLGFSGNPQSIDVSGRYAYIVSIGFPTDLRVVDISNPSAPVITGSLSIGGFPISVHVSGCYTYVISAVTNDLKVIDISNPNAPMLTGSLGIGSQPQSVFVSGRYAYVVDSGSNDLKIIDVSDPTSPSPVGSVGVGTIPVSVYVSDRYAYVVDNSSGDLRVIDVSNPNTPTLAGSLVIGNDPAFVYVAGRYVYVVDFGTNDLKVIDASNPAIPVVVGSLGIGDGPLSVQVWGRYAYVIDQISNDLKVIDVSGGEMTSLIAHSLEAGNLQVRNHLITHGQLEVLEGIYSSGDVGVAGTVKAAKFLGDGSMLTDIVGSTDDQTLSFTSPNLSIEDGNSVDLSALQDGVNDADADPTNELNQAIAFNQTTNELEINDAGGTLTTRLSALQRDNFVMSLDANDNIKIGRSSNSILGTSSILMSTFSGSNIVGSSQNILIGNNGHLINGTYGTILGGINNEARNRSTVIGSLSSLVDGDYSISLGGRDSVTTGDFSAIVGGDSNFLVENYSVIAGGLNNDIRRVDPGGGDDGDFSFIGGGEDNLISSDYSAIIGGTDNTVSGDVPFSTARSAIIGGINNETRATRAVVVGGGGNIAGGPTSLAAGEDSEAMELRSVAFGRRAKSLHQDTIVWADGMTADFVSTEPDSVILRAGGGVGINTNAPATDLDVNGTITATNYLGDGSTLTNVDTSSSNELQTLSGTGSAVTLSNGGGTREISALSAADGDPDNVVILNTIGDVFIDGATVVVDNSTNRIGMGENTPLAGVLDIRNDALDAADSAAMDQYHLMIRNETNTDGLEAGIGFKVTTTTSSGPGAAITHERTGGSGIGTLNFKTAQNGGLVVTRMTIDQTGRVFMPNLANSISGLGVEYVPSTGELIVPPSSEQFKDNIKPVALDAEKILELDPVTYNYKETGTPALGYIAEQLDELGLTHLVVYDDDGKPYGVAYKMIPLFQNELLKKHEREIDDLRAEKDAEIKQLKQQNADLEVRLQNLEALLSVTQE